MAIIEKYGKWWYDFRIDQKRYRKSTGLDATARNENAASAIEAKRRLEIIEGKTGVRKIRARLFSDAAREFLHWCEQEHRQKPRTAQRIKTSFVSLEAQFANRIVASLDPADIESYKAWRRTCTECKAQEPAIRVCLVCEGTGEGVKDITLRHDLHALSKFFRWAVVQRYAACNPVRNVSIPSDKDAERIHVLTAAEENLYLMCATGDLHDLALLMLNQGCRPEEILSLPKAAVDLDRGTLFIAGGKTKAAKRTLTLTPESKVILGRRLTGDSRWLFPTPVQYKRGANRSTDTHILRLNNAHEGVLRRIKKNAKRRLEVVIYDFRHTFATRFYQRTKDLVALKTILGHSSLRSVMKYVHVEPGHVRDAMEQYAAARAEAQKSQEAKPQ